MAVEDFVEPEVAVAVAVTAAVASPRARRVMRQSAVYGLAGILKAGDALGVFARGVGRGVQPMGEAAGEATSPIVLPGEEQPVGQARSRPSRAKAQQEEGAGS